MEKVNEIKIPKGVESISVKQHDDKIVIEFIPEKAKFKDGDFLYSDWDEENITIIYRKRNGNRLFYHASKSNCIGLCFDKSRFWSNGGDFRLATESEKKELIDAMKKGGKRWDADKKCIEDIPKPKFKVGDKVKIKDGISSKTHEEEGPGFVGSMDKFIGEKLTVKGYSDGGFVFFNEDDNEYCFSEDWLEPWREEPKNGDLAIFWDNKSLMPSMPLIRLYHGKTTSGNSYIDNFGTPWDNAVKWDGTKNQFEKVLRGEI